MKEESKEILDIITIIVSVGLLLIGVYKMTDCYCSKGFITFGIGSIGLILKVFAMNNNRKDEDDDLG